MLLLSISAPAQVSLVKLALLPSKKEVGGGGGGGGDFVTGIIQFECQRRKKSYLKSAILFVCLKYRVKTNDCLLLLW